jgi:phosphoglycerate kinase
VAGLLLEREVDTITNVMEKPERPLVAIIGGAKIADKIDILHKFIDIADFVAVGGAMANTFLAASGVDVAKSLYDREDVSLARDIMHKASEKAKSQRFVFALPRDTVGYVESRKMIGSFNHVSTGGGASLELMSGRKLPGVEALKDKDGVQ